MLPPGPPHDDEDLQESHEINVTPFIDVMLVLLIIFMVAAPLATVDVAVELPASTAQATPRPDAPIYLSVQQDLSLRLNQDPVDPAALATTLDALTAGRRDERIFVRADKGVAYGALMDTLDQLRAAGYLKVALVGLEPPPA